MGQTERVLRIQQMLQRRRFIPKKDFLEELEISPATFKRDLEFLRSRFRTDIVWDRERGGYSCDDLRGGGEAAAVPGPMYSGAEINALLLTHDLLVQLQPGLLGEHLLPLRERLEDLVGAARIPDKQVRRRIRILQMASRPVDAKCFQAVCTATLKRLRLRMTYQSRTKDERTEREVSPQRLVYYRANWYLDSWCHWRNGLRSFAVDMIQNAEVSDEAAAEVPVEALDEHLGDGYGILAGTAKHTAVLRFEPRVARWVSREVWHSRQTSEVEASGHLVLKVPYAQDHEITMDILRYGADVEVLAPEELRRRVIEAHRAAAERYAPEAK